MKAAEVAVGETYTVVGWKPKGYPTVTPWTARVVCPDRSTPDAFVVRRLDPDGPGFTTAIPAVLIQPCRTQLDLFGLPVEWSLGHPRRDTETSPRAVDHG